MILLPIVWKTDLSYMPITVEIFFQTTHNDLSEKQKALLSKGLPKKRKIPAVENVVLVASGKGGVGKSTTAGKLKSTPENN